MPDDRGGLSGLHKVLIKRPGKEPTVYYYAWRGGPRIKAEWNTPEFQAEFDQHHKADAAKRRASSAPTLVRIFDAYQDSREFAKRAPRTKKDYTRILDTLRDEFGSMPISVLGIRGTRTKFLDWRDEYGEDSARQADYHWTVLNIAINWAIHREWEGIERNPFEKAGKLYDGDRSDKVWSTDQIRTLLSVAPDHIALPFLLALYTGQRQGDLLALRWGQYDGTRISLVQGKTKMPVSVKLAAPVKSFLDATKAGMGDVKDDAHMLLTARSGDPWTEDGFRASWGRVKRDDACITGRTFHDLRGTAVTMLALARCSEAEIATITGHSLRDVKSILDKHYLHRDVRLADSGIDKLDEMIAGIAFPANQNTVGSAKPVRQANGFTGSKLAALKSG